MKAGDIVFVKGTGWVSKLIRFFDGGKEFTHVAIAVSPTQVIEAQRFVKVQVIDMNFESYEVVDLNLTDEERELLIRKAFGMVGAKYDYLQIGWYICKKLFNLKGEPWNSPNALICSELVSRVLYEIGLIPASDTLFDLTPNQLYDYLTYIGAQRPI